MDNNTCEAIRILAQLAQDCVENDNYEALSKILNIIERLVKDQGPQ